MFFIKIRSPNRIMSSQPIQNTVNSLKKFRYREELEQFLRNRLAQWAQC